MGRSRDMREVGEDDIPETTTGNHVARYAIAKEAFKELPSDDDFRLRYLQICDTCREEDDDEVKDVLVFCQGCTTAFHQTCLGPRTGSEHLITKIAPNSFVLQCRRCVDIAKNKDSLAPDQGLCLTCYEPDSSTTAFREWKTAKEEQKEREDINSEDPITDVLTDLINNPKHVLFRCTRCYRACHMHHLPPRNICYEYHLYGHCSWQPSPCRKAHLTTNINIHELNALQFLARGFPCDQGNRCLDWKCCFGHRCPFGERCTKNRVRDCRFSPDMHFADTKVVN